MPKPPRRPPPRTRKTDVVAERIVEAPLVARPADPRQAGLFDAPLPGWMRPCLPTLVDLPPTAPFFLYLPIVFLVSVALGRGPGLVGTVVSGMTAAGFVVRDGRTSLLQLKTRQYVALVEYLVVSTAMVEVCVALRRVLLSNEAALARLQTIFDTVPVGIMLAEAPSGRIVGRNKRLDEIVETLGERAKTRGEYSGWRSPSKRLKIRFVFLRQTLKRRRSFRTPAMGKLQTPSSPSD